MHDQSFRKTDFHFHKLYESFVDMKSMHIPVHEMFWQFSLLSHPVSTYMTKHASNPYFSFEIEDIERDDMNLLYVYNLQNPFSDPD